MYWLLRRRITPEGRNGKLRAAVECLIIFFLATVSYLMLIESGVRIALHASPLELRDFRHERGAKTINDAIEYDDQLGWRLKSFLHRPGFNSLEYGFRSNGGAHTGVLPGGVLAVGSSFTAGSEVSDDETWPAHLQQITGWNVNNAGQGNYVADQIIMNGERLLPIVHPRVLVVDVIPDNIIGVGYSAYGWPKPYFTVENDQLILHHSPVPRAPAPGADAGRFSIKWFLGHFAIADQFMTAFFADAWFSSDGSKFTTVRNDAVDVTCRLLSRLKQKTDTAQVTLILYLQFAGSHIIGTASEPRQSLGIAACARELHIYSVDEYPMLRRVFEEDPNRLRRYYQIEPDGSTGHKSSFGNMQVAKLVAAAIKSLGVLPDSLPASDRTTPSDAKSNQ